MMIFKNRILLVVSIMCALYAVSAFLFQVPHISPVTLPHGSATLITSYESSLTDVVLFFEFSEDLFTESLKSIKNYTFEATFFSYVLLLIMVIDWKRNLVIEIFERNISVHSLWQKTTTTL